MAAVDNMLRALDEREVAQQVGLAHDEARIRYDLKRNTVSGFDEFSDIIGDYYNHHHSTVTNGAPFPRSEATARAKEILEQQYRRRNGNIVDAYNDGHDGTNGGMRAILDVIAEGLKFRAIERYVREVFDRHVAPNSWEMKVEIIRQLIQQCGANLSSSIQADQPERYAQNFRELIQSFTDDLQRTAQAFRRL